MKDAIPYGRHYIDQDDIDAVVDVLKNHPLTQGKKVSEFEDALAEFVGAKYAVAMSSWTAGLHMACIVAGVDDSNAIVTSPITFVASSNAALYCGAEVLFSDIDKSTINLCPEGLRATVKKHKNIKAIIPVHFSGLPCDMESIRKTADGINALVIEDAAHALGAAYPDGSKVGSCKYSDMTGFSFHPVKSITAGEGGMITTNNRDIYKKLLRLRSHGINKLDDDFIDKKAAVTGSDKNPWYMEMQELGYNYRITDIQAALGKSQLKKLPNFIARRRQLAKRYDDAFSELDNFKPIQAQGRETSSHHLYVVRIKYNSLGTTRARLMVDLANKGIMTQVHYIPVTSHPYYKNLGFDSRDYPQALEFYEEALSIPLYYSLTDIEQDKVIGGLKKLLKL
jgi:UDP-4-amino-4,6-dideoxy-N-acetyl-beta-L-altrosamine transaminase